ncbi:zinc knuckle CX2CX4HX4C containing protein [Tanacetum coccineum]
MCTSNKVNILFYYALELWVGSAKDQPNVNSNFRTLVADPVFDGVNISIPCKVVEKAKHGLKRIMMNSKGFFFFKFDSRAGLEAVLEGGPWLIRKSPIILKKWSLDTRLPLKLLVKPVMLDSYTSSMCNDSWGRSSFARCLIEVNSEASLVDVVTIGIPSLSEDDFTKETIYVELMMVSNEWLKREEEGKSKSTNGGQFTSPSVKHNVRYGLKATTSEPKKGTIRWVYISIRHPLVKRW